MDKRIIKILLVDDEPDILEIVSYNLRQESYEVYTAENGKEALKIAEKVRPHLIVLDVMMPVMDGIEACKRIRKNKILKDTLVTFLTARAEDYAQIKALEAGGDDYINKPIKPKLLLSKIKSLLRRVEEVEQVDLLEFDSLSINKLTHEVLYQGEEINLPKKEFELLCLMASHPDKVFTREEILEKVWGPDVVVSDRTIDVRIRKLRKNLGDERFETIKGVGYKFISP